MNRWNQKNKNQKIAVRKRSGCRWKTWVRNFMLCGLTGWGLEILLTSVEAFAAGDMKFMGKTSIYMFPIYGMGVLLGPIGKWVDSWIKNDWKRKTGPVKNVDLWKRLLAAMEPHQVTFLWVKGHDGHPENERCDRLATTAADGTELLTDAGIV